LLRPFCHMKKEWVANEFLLRKEGVQEIQGHVMAKG
jgi:hypothetical protein